MSRKQLTVLAALSVSEALAAAYFTLKGSDFCTALSCIYSEWVLALGVAFYLAVGASFLIPAWNRITVPLLLAGVTVHTALLSFDYVVTGGLCPVCLGFAAMTCLLLALSLGNASGLIPLAAASILMIMAILTGIHQEQPTGGVPIPAPEIYIVPSDNVQNTGKPVAFQPKTADKPAKTVKPIPEPKFQSPSTIAKKPAAKPVTLTVQDTRGNPVTLDITNRPALLFAPWCPECHKVLARLSHQKELPYLVGVWYPPGKQDEVATVLAQEGLPNAEYFLMPNPPVKGVPALMYNDNGQMKTVSGDVAVENLMKELMQP